MKPLFNKDLDSRFRWYLQRRYEDGEFTRQDIYNEFFPEFTVTQIAHIIEDYLSTGRIVQRTGGPVITYGFPLFH